MTIQQLVENKTTLDCQQICTTLIQTFNVQDPISWESVLPAQQQQEYFGGETLRLVAEHPILSKQKDIRAIALKKGSISQMLFFYVCLQDAALPKKNIQEVTKKFISGGDANRFIIWFFGNKDNTELKVVLSAKEGKKIVLKTLPFGINQPYYKTYNFILNEVSQKVNQLFVEPIDLWKVLWKAFDISIINRKFYEEIKDAFTSLLAQLNKKKNPFTNEEDRAQFAIRLIGRIIFCWFLKRKDVLHDEALSSVAVNNYTSKGELNYYHSLLEPLFFDVLNTPEKERRAGLPKIIAKYPFLNGGLFDAQDNDFKDNLLLDIENSWFYNLFSKTLEKYNFTVDENSSSNAEIAIDPEMLGRIFENLLAEQNPETGDSARKATGSFYTPREIVDYMVEQSISEYLKSYFAGLTEQVTEIKENLFGVIPNQQLSLPTAQKVKVHATIEQDFEDFVHTQMLPATLAKYEDKISDALYKIKVLDPACGSGAFPIGILQKIVALKQQLHPKTKNYTLKLDTIQNSIYGVDIQPMAVELSRLRCWLSLVVDEDPKDIKALPNLDFKFVCADSLVDVPLAAYQTDLSAKNLKELEINVEKYFSPDYKNKKKLKADIKTNIYNISKSYHDIIGGLITKIRQEEKTASPTRIKQLRESLTNYSLMDAKWNSYENVFKNRKVDFFNPTYFFPSAKNGFDVVVANPPYIQLSKDFSIEESYKTQLRDTFKTSGGRLNTFIFFIHKGIDLLKANGVLTYIIPNTILTQDYYKYTREQILRNNFLKKIVNYIDMPFENAVVENVTIIIKKNEVDNYPIEIYTDDLETISLVSTKSKNNFLTQNNFSFNVNTNEVIEFIFSRNIKPLKIFCEVNQAIALKGDKSISLKNDNKDKKYYKLLDGRNINKYTIEWDGVYLDYDVERIHSCKRKDIFESKEKLMFRRVSESLIFTYDEEQHFALNTIVVLNLNSNQKISLKYLLSLLNSKLLNYLYKGRFKSTKKVFSEIQARSVEQLPIIESTNEEQFIRLVDFILYLKKNTNTINISVSNNLLVKNLEDIIDGMVLELYFEEEMITKKVNIIALVEAALKKAEGKTVEESIYNFYRLVSNPDSEIRNRILLFPIVSPDILKPILQG